MSEETSAPENNNETKITLDDLLNALLDTETPLAARFLYRLSDLEDIELERVNDIWLQISPSRRQNLLEDLETLAESSTVVSFNSVCKLGLEDPEADVRLIAIRALWECHDRSLIDRFIDLLSNDPSEAVRAQAAAGLGQFIYLGELDKIPADKLKKIVDQLIDTVENIKDPKIQQRALESLGFSSDSRIGTLIEDAYDYGDPEHLCSALLAMGRSADEHWNTFILDKIDHSDMQVRLEATRAAGELAVPDAQAPLITLLYDEHDEIRTAAAWSLSEIGGNEARHALQLLIEETEDEEELDLLEIAMDNLEYDIELQDFNPLNIPPTNTEDRSDLEPEEE